MSYAKSDPSTAGNRQPSSRPAETPPWLRAIAVALAATLGLQLVGIVPSHAAVPDYDIVSWGRDDPGGANDAPEAVRSGVVALGAGNAYVLALKEDGSVVSWGSSPDGRAIVPSAARTGVAAISANSTHALAAKKDGSVVQWGSSSTNISAPPSEATDAIAVSAGWLHNLVLRRDGTVVAWGLDQSGQVSAIPSGLTGVKALSGGGNQSLALLQEGSVVCWGLAQLCDPTSSATRDFEVSAIAAGYDFSLALTTTGKVLAWGGPNNYGQTDVPAAAQSDVVAISAGSELALALKRDGTVVAWGLNLGGETDVPASATGVTTIAAGMNLAVALRTAQNAVPARPILTGVTPGDGYADVAFTPPAPGYPRSLTYTATATPAGGGAPTSSSGTGSPITIPNLANGTSYSFTVTATNATGSTASESIAATVGVAPSIVGVPPAATVGSAYDYTFTVAGAPAPVLTVAGTLPAGLKLSSAGRLTGTPTTAGATSFTVTATNVLGASSTDVTVTVAPRPTPNADVALAITASTASDRTITYTLTVTNAGPSAATGLSTVALLPSGIGTTVTASGKPTRILSQVLVWGAESLKSNGTLTYTVTVRPTRPGPKTLTAVIGSPQVPDPNQANNRATRTS